MTKLEDVMNIIAKEPNYETFDYKGYHCIIKRMMFVGGGQLNGYVRIPENHPYYNKVYDAMDIECHGGPTFADKLEDEEGFYIGFDTAHYGDFMPFMSMIGMHSFEDGTYRDITYVRNECKRIVEQLIKKQ